MSDDRLYDEKIDGAASTIESCLKMGGVILKAKDTPKFGFGPKLPQTIFNFEREDK